MPVAQIIEENKNKKTSKKKKKRSKGKGDLQDFYDLSKIKITIELDPQNKRMRG